MNAQRMLLAVPALALVLACRTAPIDRERLVYAPHEEGLTLTYENPSLEGQVRLDARLQVRVEAAKPLAGPDRDFEGRLVYTRLTGIERYAFEVKDGGLRITDDQNRGSEILPAGFPERTQAWGDKEDTRFRVLGRASNPQFDRFLPKDAPRIGIWIEGVPATGKGVRTRTFILPDVGPAEVLEWRDGAWKPVLRLTGRGFTDLPPSEPAPVPPPAPAKAGKAPKAVKA